MAEVSFTGHIRAMRADSEFFGAEDLAGLPDVPFQIADVKYDEKLKVGGAVSKDKFFLILRDKQGRNCKKKMLLNAGRRKMLAAMYGPVAGEWIGKWCYVYVDQVKSPSGGMTLGMKFRNQKGAPPDAKTLQQAQATEHHQPPIDDSHPQLQPEGTPILGSETLEQVFDRYLEVLQRAKTPQAVNNASAAFFGPESAHRWTDDNMAEGELARADRLEEINTGAK